MPSKPKLMFQICQKLRRGLLMRSSGGVLTFSASRRSLRLCGFNRLGQPEPQRRRAVLILTRHKNRYGPGRQIQYNPAHINNTGTITKSIMQSRSIHKSNLRYIECELFRFHIIIERNYDDALSNNSRVSILLWRHIKIHQTPTPQRLKLVPQARKLPDELKRFWFVRRAALARERIARVAWEATGKV